MNISEWVIEKLENRQIDYNYNYLNFLNNVNRIYNIYDKKNSMKNILLNFNTTKI